MCKRKDCCYFRACGSGEDGGIEVLAIDYLNFSSSLAIKLAMQRKGVSRRSSLSQAEEPKIKNEIAEFVERADTRGLTDLIHEDQKPGDRCFSFSG